MTQPRETRLQFRRVAPWSDVTTPLGLWVANTIKRPWKNWRLRRMWLAAAPEARPDVCPRIGRLDRTDVVWALEAAAKIVKETAK